MTKNSQDYRLQYCSMKVYGYLSQHRSKNFAHVLQLGVKKFHLGNVLYHHLKSQFLFYLVTLKTFGTVVKTKENEDVFIVKFQKA